MGRGETSDLEALLAPAPARARPDLQLPSEEEIEERILDDASRLFSSPITDSSLRRVLQPYGNVRGAPGAINLCAGPEMSAPSDSGAGEKLWRGHLGVVSNQQGEWVFCAFTTHGRSLGEQTNVVFQSDDLQAVVKKLNSKIQSKIRPTARSVYEPIPGTGDISDEAKFKVDEVRARLASRLAELKRL